MKEKLWMTGVSLTEYERAILERESERLGFHNISATLRFIVRRYDEQKQSDLTPAQQVVEELRGEM